MRAILPLLAWLLLVTTGTADARALRATIARVNTPVAVLQDVRIRLEWPADAATGRLEIRAARAAAPDLGYRWRDLAWACTLERDGKDGWRCRGPVRASGKGPLQLSLALGPAATDAVLGGPRGARLAVHRVAATPDLTTVVLTRIPAAWAEALVAAAWPEARLGAGTLDGRFAVRAPPGRPLRLDGRLQVQGLGFDTPDGRIAGQELGGEFGIGWRRHGPRDLVQVDGALEGGEFLAGSAYVALPSAPVRVSLSAEGDGAGPWRLPRLLWNDPGVLRVEGSAVLDPGQPELELAFRSDDAAPLGARYLSGWLGLAGLDQLRMRGALDGALRVAAGEVHAASLQVHGLDLDDPQQRFRFAGLDGDVRFSVGVPVTSALRWREGALYGLGFGAATLPMASADGELRLRETVTVPAFGGHLRVDGMRLRPPAGERGFEARFGLVLDRLDIGQLARALDWPAFRGELSGHIPDARYANNRLDFDGGLGVALFGGQVTVSALAMERPFGVAPTLTADIDFEDVDLLALTEVFDFGSITGRLDGRIHDLRLVDWKATAFDARLRTEPHPGVRQRISQRAVQNISSVGDGSLLTGLQSRLIGLFDDFGYRAIGISCRLANEVCVMDGLPDADGSDSGGFTIVAGAGLPRLTVIGHNRRVDWPTLVERLAAVASGEVRAEFE